MKPNKIICAIVLTMVSAYACNTGMDTMVNPDSATVPPRETTQATDYTVESTLTGTTTTTTTVTQTTNKQDNPDTTTTPTTEEKVSTENPTPTQPSTTKPPSDNISETSQENTDTMVNPDSATVPPRETTQATDYTVESTLTGTTTTTTTVTQTTNKQDNPDTTTTPTTEEKVSTENPTPTQPSTTKPPKPSSLYLDNISPPCVLGENTGQDACPVEIPPTVETVTVRGAPPLWPIEGGVPTFTEILLGRGISLAAIHIVIRGTVQKNTTRCATFPIKLHNYINETSLFRDFYHHYCFADINVSEYIIGTGPTKLTVSLHQELIAGKHLDNNLELTGDAFFSVLKDPQSRTATVYEGKELVLFLVPTFSVAVESWQRIGDFGTWFVQRNNNNNIRAVSQDIIYAITDEQRRQLNLPLTLLTEQIKQANTERNSITNGKVGTSSPTLPSLVTDANLLKNFYTSVGAVYDDTEEATKLPPPVPGENDPTAPTIPTNDGTTETTATTPGEEPTTPSPTDDAATTATTSATTTATGETTTTAAATTTTSEPAGAETVTGTTTTTTEPPSEDGDSTEEQTTTTSTLPSADGNPSVESSSPDEETNPGPGVSLSDDDGVPEDGAATIPPGGDGGSSLTNNQDANDEPIP